jgi:EAL domain-containing protein (putative c-di-GMP-specific phosphodiesterase class I)
MVSPAEFIPVAEGSGLIVGIGEWVIRRACAEAATWAQSLKVAVNVSPLQFKCPRLLDQVAEALQTSGLSPGRLELEITESVLLADNDASLATLHRLHELGTRISMDDFGTGYSSLSYLRSFPFDKIKIDQSFVRDLDTKDDSRVIVRAIISLGQSLGIDVLAEGVETPRQLGLLRREGCGEVQGYIFSPPRPARGIPALISALDRELRAVTDGSAKPFSRPVVAT